MPMRQDCKFFESRTYGNGETVRKCDLDLAPEAPWRCPANCKAFQPRLADVNWHHGSLVTPPTPPEPPGMDERGADIAALLDAAEDIVNAAVPDALAQVEVALPHRLTGAVRAGLVVLALGPHRHGLKCA